MYTPLPACTTNRLEFISKQAKGQQKKGKDRQRRYDDLVAAASAYVKDSQVILIWWKPAWS